MARLCSRLTAYMLIGWCGFVATVSMIAFIFVDWATIAGWITIVCTTIFFYVTTIEADYVECESASFITIPAGLIMIFAGVEPINYVVAVLGPLALLYGLAHLYAYKFPWLERRMKTAEQRAAATAKREAKLAQLREEHQKYLQSQTYTSTSDFS